MEDNTQYELHVEFIELAKKLGFKEELEAARLEMHDVYPLTEGKSDINRHGVNLFYSSLA